MLSGLLRLLGSGLGVESESLLARRRAWARLNSFYVRCFPQLFIKPLIKIVWRYLRLSPQTPSFFCARRCDRESYKNFMEKTCICVLCLLHSRLNCAGSQLTIREALKLSSPLTLFASNSRTPQREKGETFNHLHARADRC